MPIGQFGTRSMGGKEAASARYIYTHLNKITRYLFPDADDHILKYCEDDGQYVEPEWYMPIIPTVLVNGCEGIGTGWSTAIPSYNPREIVESFKKRLQLTSEDFDELHPFYKGKGYKFILK
jgi:DNA topoisomerase II